MASTDEGRDFVQYLVLQQNNMNAMYTIRKYFYRKFQYHCMIKIS